MNPQNLIGHFAAIPIFDWRGPEFLLFYLVALVVAVIWSLRRGSASMKRFDSHQEPRDLTDPFEIAYLAGGAHRVFQLALGRLLKLNLAEWKKRWNGNYVVATGLPVRVELHPVEIALLTRLQGKKKGVPLSNLSSTWAPQYAAIEARLAVAGLRPTQAERGIANQGIIVPLVVLIGIGVIKLLIGIGRDRPVGFLIALLILTAIIAFVISAKFNSRQGYLTAAGRRALEKLRSSHSYASTTVDTHPDLANWSTGVALMGATAMIGLAAQEEITAALLPRGAAHSASSSSSCGTTSGCGGTSGGDSGGSSGCGSSGCGSSCGGCGGGGGD